MPGGRAGSGARLRQHHGEQAVLQRVAAEDVGDLAGQHHADAGVEQGPRRVFARAAAKVAPGHEDLCAARLGRFNTKSGRRAVGAVAPVVEGVASEPLRWVVVRNRAGMMRSVSMFSCGSTTVRERRAVAKGSWFALGQQIARIGDDAGQRGGGATSGLASTVRAPGRRPSKLRLEVLTTSCPGWARSPFMAMHMEQPGSRHSAPAAREHLVQSSASAARCTATGARHHQHPHARRDAPPRSRPRRAGPTGASWCSCRRTPRRPPPAILPARSALYLSAAVLRAGAAPAPARRWHCDHAGCASEVTVDGSRVRRSSLRDRSARRRSDLSVRHRDARSCATPCGPAGGPLSQSKVVSSGAIRPARAPGLDGHVAHRHAPSIDSAADGAAAVFDDVASAAIHDGR